ncbi:MAG: EAL domain-containing protein, partial [Actinobacteria bacterium]|nr:EAL domain-containing protein [Actinomycetota bacterium]
MSSKRHPPQFAQLRSLPAAVRHRLVLEVTETALVNRPELWAQRLQQLRDFGVRIAIDDFGVGYASIAYLWVPRIIGIHWHRTTLKMP